MATLVDDLIALSRIGRQDLFRREVKLATLVEDVVTGLASATDGRVPGEAQSVSCCVVGRFEYRARPGDRARDQRRD